MSANSREDTNRANAQHSTGPKTAEGKARVSGNRTVHNLTGERVLLPGESLDAYNELAGTLFAEHDPQTPSETYLVEQLVHNTWRLNRVSEMETEILSVMAGVETPSQSPAAYAAYHMIRNSKTAEEALARLDRYGTSIRRAYNGALTQLRLTRNNRLKEEIREEKAKMAAARRPAPPQPLENLNYDSKPPATPAEPAAAPKPPSCAPSEPADAAAEPPIARRE